MSSVNPLGDEMPWPPQESAAVETPAEAVEPEQAVAEKFYVIIEVDLRYVRGLVQFFMDKGHRLDPVLALPDRGKGFLIGNVPGLEV